MDLLMGIWQAWLEMFQHIWALASSGALASLFFIICGVSAALLCKLQSWGNYCWEEFLESLLMSSFVGGVVTFGLWGLKHFL